MRGSGANTVSAAVIVSISAVLGTLVSFGAPGIDRSMRDWMVRARGPLPAPDDIAIVAIDEPSIARLGRFPWPRGLSARAIDFLAMAQPKAIALDVLFSDPASESDDNALADSIRRAGNVVVAAQLTEPSAAGGPTSWLLPLPAIARAAAAIGHVNVSTESDGVARQILIQASDDQGHSVRAMAVEVIRIAEGVPEQSLTETPSSLLLGSRVIPVDTIAPSVVIGAVPGTQSSIRTLRAARMAIDYLGPPGSFRTYSFADVLDGRIPSAQLRGKYILVGATAGSLGDRLTSPFVHQTDERGDQHGSFMPGVEVLANTLNTILRSRFYSETPEWLAVLCGALVAALTMFLLAIAQGRYETIKHLGVLVAMTGAILLAGYLAFTRLLLFPPLTLSLVSLASSDVLGLLRRSFVTSSRLDRTIAEIERAGEHLHSVSLDSAAESIARLADAEAVAIYTSPIHTSQSGGRMRLAAAHGPPPSAKAAQEPLAIPIEGLEGVVSLVIATRTGRPPSVEIQRLCAAIAGSAAEVWTEKEEPRWWWPRGLAWKARSLGYLSDRILDRANFVDLAMQSVEDALIIAGVDGRITFANRRAGALLHFPGDALRGRNLFDLLAEAEQSSPEAGRDVMVRLVLDRATIEREITIRGARPRHFTLRMAAVCSGEARTGPARLSEPPETRAGSAEPDLSEERSVVRASSSRAAQRRRGAVRGIVASLSDITRQYELRQTNDDVMALVSHEMRTPLTAIQGMSELLAQFEIDPQRRREMSLAIHDEAKRLTHMIGEYLDITRLESGTTELRRSPVRIDALVERALLMLDPLAAARSIRLMRRLNANLPPVLADANLLSRAIGNLVSNAIKYSPQDTEVVISARIAANGVSIEVADQGYGIPEASVDRVFEKFYRVPRVQDVDVPGTGLGLALVREIAELHDGSASVRSAVGSGSVFTLWIPCSDG